MGRQKIMNRVVVVVRILEFNMLLISLYMQFWFITVFRGFFKAILCYDFVLDSDDDTFTSRPTILQVANGAFVSFLWYLYFWQVNVTVDQRSEICPVLPHFLGSS
jgi:hypothetical protein